MTSVSVVVPVLTLLNRDGGVDREACVAYAQRARETWIDAFLVCGSLGLGPVLTTRTRGQIMELWLEHMPVGRLLGCAWDPAEVDEALRRGLRPVAVIRGAEDDDAVLRVLEPLPPGAYVYSHPHYTPTVLSPAVAEKARAQGTLPAGAKVSKVELGEVQALRKAAGPKFALYDGRCRYIRASLEAGATGVVAVPLAMLPADLPPREDLEALQKVINRGQDVVDGHPGVVEQADALRKMLIATL